MATALLIVHGLVAVALLGAITHQTLATWAPARARPGSFFGRFRAVPSASFANAVVVLYVVSALLGAIVYLYFRVDIRPGLERAGHWRALGFFDIKEHFVSIGLALLPAYWVCWRRPLADESVANARRPDRDPRLHRLVELSDRSRPEQHHGLRAMTSSPAVPPVRLCLRDGVRGPLRDRAQAGSRAVHRLSLARRRASGHAPFARHRRSRDGVPCSGDVLVRLDRHGRARGAACSASSPRLVPERWTRRVWSGWVWVVPVAGDGRMRLPHVALVSTLVTNVSSWHIALPSLLAAGSRRE